MDRNILEYNKIDNDHFKDRPICVENLQAITEDNKGLKEMSISVLNSLREYVEALKLEN